MPAPTHRRKARSRRRGGLSPAQQRVRSRRRKFAKALRQGAIDEIEALGVTLSELKQEASQTMTRYKDFDAAVDELEAIEFTAKGQKYTVPGDPAAGPILRLLAEGRINDPAATGIILTSLLGREQYAQLIGQDADAPYERELLDECKTMLRRLRDMAPVELAEEIDALAERIDAPPPEPTSDGVGLKQLLSIVTWVMEELGFSDIAAKLGDGEPGEGDQGNGSRSPMSSSIGER